MLSQVLFGEYVEIVSKKNKNWYRIKCSWDNTLGWIDPKQFEVLKEKQLHHFTDCSTFALDHLQGLSSASMTIPISIGSNLYQCDGLNVKMPFGAFQYSGQIVNLRQSLNSRKLLISMALRYKHCPYLYGGRSILGIDAPGFLQVIFKMIGVNLPRYCQDQARLGYDVGFRSQAEIGDLAFFEDESQRINHVGLIIDEDKIMHVNGQVRIDNIDHQGIFNLQEKKYTFKLRTIRRIAAIQ